jgi:cyanophycinase
MSTASNDAASADDSGPPRGRLVIHGGGEIHDDFRRLVLDVAGGPGVRVLAVPQGTQRLDIWDTICDLWREVGAGDAELLDANDPGFALEQIGRADLIWLTSGDQCRLTAALAGTDLPEALRARYRAGATVGGISAGAAVMSAAMITGEDPDPVTGTTDVAEGLGFWPEVIIDQHCLTRQRVYRLTRAVLDRPDRVGIGIDEHTFIVVRDGRWFEVGGRSRVVVVDHRGAREELLFLEPGSFYHLDRGRLPGPFEA